MTPSTFVRLATLAGAAEIVNLSEAKVQCRVRHNAEDTFISGLIAVARESVEDYCKQSLIASTWRVGYSHDKLKSCGCLFTGPLELCRPPVATISSVKIQKTKEGEVVLSPSDYIFDADDVRGAVVLKTALAINSLDVNHPYPIKITFNTSFYSSASYKHAIKLMISNLYENRVPVVQGSLTLVPLNVKLLLDQKKNLNSY
jgi:uncharacterized phiE125 gp8 family phage protein